METNNKLREALSDACYAMFNFLKTQYGGYEEMANALDKAKSALAEPVKNCEVGTAEERLYRYNRLRDEINERYKRLGEIPPAFAFPTAFEWEDRPYEEGESNGSN